MTKIFFATDVHGSDICWKKFINAGKFYTADAIILGGDLTGKAIVPIIHQGNNTYRAILLEQISTLHGEDEVAEMVKEFAAGGIIRTGQTPDEIDELNPAPQKLHDLFVTEVLQTAEEWLSYADKKLAESHIPCYVAPGNDDMFELDNMIRESKFVKLAEGEVVQIDEHHEMISSGWTNPTPWHTFREESEEQLQDRYEQMIAQVKDLRNCIFNIHVPPYGSTLDEAPELTADLRPKYAGNVLVPVGSKALRTLIEKCQPLLGLFGHIHEAKGAARMGKTLCINPGSMYEQGCLLGALVNLDRNKIKDYLLTTG